MIDGRFQVVADAGAYEFQRGLLHRPEADESSIGMLRRLYQPHLLVIHRIVGQPLLVFTYALHIDADRLVADDAGRRLLAVAQVEVDLRMSDAASRSKSQISSLINTRIQLFFATDYRTKGLYL